MGQTQSSRRPAANCLAVFAWGRPFCECLHEVSFVETKTFMTSKRYELRALAWALPVRPADLLG